MWNFHSYWVTVLGLCFISIILAQKQSEDSHCVMYGVCGESENGPIPCVYNGQPVLLTNSTMLSIIDNLCPTLNAKKDANLCCNNLNIEQFQSSMNTMGAVFQRCPSCYQNLADLFCHLTCGRDQSNYINVTAERKNKEGKMEVAGIAYFVAEKFASGLFSSCLNVRMSTTTDKAIAVMCGKDCTPHSWLAMMAGYSPFTIDFQLKNSDNFTVNETVYYPMNDTIYPCDVAPKEGSVACSIVDCPISLPPCPLPHPFEIGGIPGLIVIMIIIFIVAAIVIVGSFVCYGHKKQKREDEDVLIGSSEDSQKSISVSCIETLGLSLDETLRISFNRWGKFCATYPWFILACGVAFIIAATYGLSYFTVTTNPVNLWSAPNSEVREQKNYFDSHFEPFYRTEQVIIIRKNKTLVQDGNRTFSSAFDREFLHKVLNMQNEITALTAEVKNRTIQLTDICYTPVNEGGCMIQSAVNWFQNNASNLDYYENIHDYLQHIVDCTSNPYLITESGLSCYGDYGGPVFPYVALGGVQSGDYDHPTALIITIMVKNHLKDSDNKHAAEWEKVFIEYMKNFTDPDMEVIYSSERSIQDELNRESISDIKTVVISYLVMFAYVAITLGQYHSPGMLLVKSKLLLGLGGVLIVLASVASSVGIFSYMGIPATLIIIEVIPFLVLAVGVDNIFIIVQAYYRNPRHELETREEHIGRVIGQIAPSLLLAGVSECSCFFLGALSDMPAVHVFALFSGLALSIDFLLQLSCFVALLSLDLQREESNRYEICCCAHATNVEIAPRKSQGLLYRIFDKRYSPFLMKDSVRAVVLVVFTGWLASSIAVINQVDVGLDQKLSMPDDSYVLKYFEGLEKYLSVGPPVYFVVKSGFNYADFNDQNAICSIGYCYRESLVAQVSVAAQQANETYIAHAPLDWLDTYFSWIGDGAHCCRVYPNHTFCPLSDSLNCTECNLQNDTVYRPYPDKFFMLFKDYMNENPSKACVAGGHASFSTAVELKENGNETEIGATHFMTYHTILKTSQDYTNALRSAREIADNITKTFRIYNVTDKDAEVFPYSIFYVFYAQYLSVTTDTAVNISISIIAIFIVTLLLLGLDVHSAVIIVFTILMITIDLMGMMYWLNISLNAVSLVNIVMSVGISVEFCSHIIRSFAYRPHGTRIQRAQYALAHMGSSVLSGITLTKFGGIIVLAFSKSMIFQVFYFRMYLCIVLIGAAHGLIFLPVFLSIAGPPVKKIFQFQEQLNKAASRNEKMSESMTTVSDNGNFAYQKN